MMLKRIICKIRGHKLGVGWGSQFGSNGCFDIHFCARCRSQVAVRRDGIEWPAKVQWSTVNDPTKWETKP